MEQTLEEETKKLAEFMHDVYEEVAKSEGWETQKKTRVKFDDLPIENKRTMLAVAGKVLGFVKAKTEVYAPCPNCNGKHEVIWTQDSIGDKPKKLSGIFCPPNGHTYLVDTASQLPSSKTT